jgi:hypothetical protein
MLRVALAAADAAELAAPDGAGRLPLHYLCANQKATPALLQLLADAHPAAAVAVGADGGTPLSCLFEGLAAAAGKPQPSSGDAAQAGRRAAREAMMWRAQVRKATIRSLSPPDSLHTAC